MPNPQMPSGLHMRPSEQQYGFDAPGGAMRTPVAGGTARTGEQFSREAQFFNITLVLDLQEFSVWNTFFLRRIAKGTIPFDLPLDSGYGVSPHACTIIPDSYTVNRTNGVGMVVAFQVEAINQAYDMPDQAVDALLDLWKVAGGDSNALLLRIKQFALEDSFLVF
jgi:hypothetical protein